MTWVTARHKVFEDIARGLGCIVCRNQGRVSAVASLVAVDRSERTGSQRFFRRIPLCRVHYMDGGLGVAVYGAGIGSKDRLARSTAIFESKFGTLEQLLKQVHALCAEDPRFSAVESRDLQRRIIPLEFAEFAVPTVANYQPLEGSPAVQTAVVDEPLPAPVQHELLEAEPSELDRLINEAEEAKAELDIVMDEYLASRTSKNEDRLRDQRLAYLACCRQVTEKMMEGHGVGH